MEEAKHVSNRDHDVHSVGHQTLTWCLLCASLCAQCALVMIALGENLRSPKVKTVGGCSAYQASSSGLD